VPVESGILEITSIPDRAEVIVDGQRRGTTPFRSELAPGSHALRLRRSGYRETAEEVIIEAGRNLIKEYRLEPQEEPAVEYVLGVTSRPSDADVFIDGRFQGKTPVDALSVGKRTVQIQVRRNGWEPQSVEVTLDPGRNEKHFVLAPAAFTLELDSDPRGAEVFSGDESWGKTPLKKSLAAGSYPVELRLPGYRTGEATLEVTQNTQRRLQLVPLAKVPVQVRVGPKANVLLDGRLIGEVPPVRDLEVEEGRHTLVFILPESEKTFQVEVTLRAGEDWEFRMAMQTGRLILINRTTGERITRDLAPIK
jgi:hypothetical protein